MAHFEPRSRATFWREILVLPAWRWLVLAPLALLGAFQEIREELPLSVQAKLQLPNYVPTWSWWAWLLIVCGLVILIVLESAYRKVRSLDEKLIALQAQPSGSSCPILPTDQVFIDIDGHSFAEPGTTGYPRSTKGVRLSMRLQVVLNAIHDMTVESLDLEVLDRRIPSDWTPKTIGGVPYAEYVYFGIPASVNPGDHVVRLVAFAEQKWWRSRDYTITFPVSC